jgi:hypothetical protein
MIYLQNRSEYIGRALFTYYSSNSQKYATILAREIQGGLSNIGGRSNYTHRERRMSALAVHGFSVVLCEDEGSSHRDMAAWYIRKREEDGVKEKI